MSRTESFLKSLISVSSPTTDPAAVRSAHTILANELKSIGFSISWVKATSLAPSEDLLIAEYKGTEDSFVTCVSHVDTVLSNEDAGPYRREQIDGEMCARGAGIIDNKGGLVVMVESLRLFLEKNPRPSVGFRIVSSPNEETGSGPWHKVFAEFGTRSIAVLGFEPALDDGSIISSRRGNRWYNIEVKGREAHTGRCRGEELNAAHEASRLIVRLLSLRNQVRAQSPEPDDDAPNPVSLHVGHIEGGRDRHNVVCGDVHIKVDIRFTTFEQRNYLHEGILQILSSPEERNRDGLTSKITYEIVDNSPPFDENPDNANLISELCEKIRTHEKQNLIRAKKAGGAGDVNHMSRPGLLVLDGLGPVGGRMHSVEEFLILSSLDTRSRALAEWYPSLIRHVQRQKPNR